MRWVVLLLLASCGSADPHELRDGDRLRLTHWVYEDGTRQWDPSTFFDMEIETECQRAVWSDGHTYCTPVATAIAYADASCSSPVGRVPRGAPRPYSFLRAFSLNSIKRPSRMFRPTSDREPLAQFWLWDGMTCDGPFDGSGATYLDVEEVAPVRMYEHDAGEGRIRLTTFSTDDGLWVPEKLVDTMAESACTPAGLPDGSTACVPSTTAETFVFRDAACSENLAISSDGSALPPVARVDSDPCPRFFHVGRSVLNFPAYVKYASCEPIELGAVSITHELAAPFPLASLEARIAGDGPRLQAIEVSAGSVAAPATALYDAAIDATCEPTVFETTIRCLPRMRRALTAYYFTTATCDEAIPFLVVERTPCDPPTRFALRGRAIITVSEPYAGPIYVRFDGATCEPYDPGGDVYTTSTIVPVEMFAEARRE